MGRKRGVQYKAGSFWRSDDRSGQTVRAERTREEWTGAIVDQKLWEPRQPQDFVRGVPDEQNVPDARPKPPPVFVGTTYYKLSRNALPRTTFIYLESISGISSGDRVGVMLDSGCYFNTTVSGAPTADGINLAAPLPTKASSGNVVTGYTA